jgi:hypothetical protein
VQRQRSVIVAVGKTQVAATSQAGRYRKSTSSWSPAGPAAPSTAGVMRIAAAPTAQVHTAFQTPVSAAVNS